MRARRWHPCRQRSLTCQCLIQPTIQLYVCLFTSIHSANLTMDGSLDSFTARVLLNSGSWLLSTVIPVTRHPFYFTRSIHEGSTTASMPSTVTYMPMLNPTNSPVICMPFYKHILCKFNNGRLVKILSAIYWKRYECPIFLLSVLRWLNARLLAVALPK